MKKNHPFLFVILIGFLFISCNTDDDSDQFNREAIPLFDQSVTSIIHGDEVKSWHITEVINIYYDSNYDLEINLDCVKDDIYFGQNDDGIFTADVEIFQSRLLYFNDTVILEYVRGYVNNEGTASGFSQRWYRLAEISEDRMVFHREGGQFIGEYREALVFERIVD